MGGYTRSVDYSSCNFCMLPHIVVGDLIAGSLGRGGLAVGGQAFMA